MCLGRQAKRVWLLFRIDILYICKFHRYTLFQPIQNLLFLNILLLSSISSNFWIVFLFYKIPNLEIHKQSFHGQYGLGINNPLDVSIVILALIILPKHDHNVWNGYGRRNDYKCRSHPNKNGPHNQQAELCQQISD